MKETIFVKYNRTRREEFQIRTSIIEEAGQKWVEKTALTKAAVSHIQSLQEKKEQLKHCYQNIEAADVTVSADGRTCLLYTSGTSQDFVKAVELAYEDMGVVTDQDQNILWNRTNRGNIRNIRDLQNTAAPIIQHLGEFTENKKFEDGLILLDAKGLALNPVSYTHLDVYKRQGNQLR